MNKEEKIKSLNEKLSQYEEKLRRRMKGYRGVIHESAMSEMRHQEVMVLKAMVAGLKSEIQKLENSIVKDRK